MSMTKDMTSGTPYKLILSFAWPLILGNVFQQLYNMVDTVIVGKYVGVNALAAVGSTGAINFLVIGFATGICSGFSIMIAQSFGAGKYSDMRKYVANSIYLSAAVAVILTVATMLLTGPILRITNTPDEIYHEAYNYIVVIFAGISATIFYNMLAGILRSLGDSKSPLIFLGISSVLNIILDLTFIIVFKMGVFGAGLATVIAQGISAVLCLFYIIKNFDILKFEKDELKFDKARSLSLVSIGVPMALQFSITAIGSIVLQSAVNSLGTISVASATAAMKIQTVVMGPMESMGIAMATYCGQNKGAGEYERIRTGIRQSLIMQMVYCVVSFAAVALFGGVMTMLFIDKRSTDAASIEQILHLSRTYLVINGLFYPTLGILFIIRNSLQGMGYSFLPMLAGVSELAARTLVAFAFVSSFGFGAVCMASPVAWVFADTLLIIVYFVKMKELRHETERKPVVSF